MISHEERDLAANVGSPDSDRFVVLLRMASVEQTDPENDILFRTKRKFSRILNEGNPISRRGELREPQITKQKVES